jgi:photosynthetic reaction center cytochrome c subunit
MSLAKRVDPTRIIAFGFFLTLGTANPCAQGAQGTQTEPPAEQAYKNIQALKGVPASQIRTVMSLISTSVGMRCDACHVPNENEKDDKETKKTARSMIQMVLNINKSAFDGQTEVSCYTCHRGQQRPVAVPMIGGTPNAVPAPPAAPASAQSLPSFDQILEKYMASVGSGAAYEKLKTRVMRGTVTDAKGVSLPVEVVQAAPGMISTLMTTPGGTVGSGYDGTGGWTKTARGARDLAGIDLALIRRAADIARALKIKEEALSPRVTGKVPVGGREAYAVAARADGQRVQLFFDTETGLLLRRRVMIATPVGALPQQTDYEDYREVDGIRLPFVVKFAGADAESATTTVYKEISHNSPIEQGKFSPPGK